MIYAKIKTNTAKHEESCLSRAKTYSKNAGARRIFCAFLCLVMLMGSLYINSVATAKGADISSIEITYNGKVTDRLVIPENEKAKLTAKCTPNISGITYQWQILEDAQSDSWVNIYDGTSRELTLSYVMVKPLLDVSGGAYIRCKAEFNGYECVSAPLSVTVEYIPPFDNAEVVKQTSKAQTAKPQSKKKSLRRASSADTNEDLLVNVEINYLDGVSGLPIYSSYTGTVNVSVEAYAATVISPTYLGYAPYYDSKSPDKTLPEGSSADFSPLFPDSASVIHLNVKKGYSESRYVVNVYYFAIDVPYAVRYYFQNVHDDNYTENVGLYVTSTAKTGTIITSEQLAATLDKSMTVGFTKLYHYPESVAADGSTVFECYYDRNYSMLKFDCNGGYGTEPIYARYGTPFLVNDPTYHGYVFAGWDKQDENGQYDGIKDELPSSVPNGSYTYRAIWVQANTTYNVAYWLQNADDDDYNYIGTVKQNALSGNTVTPNDAPALTEDLYICGNDDEQGHTHDETDCKVQHAEHYVLDTKKNENIKAVVKGDGSTVLNVYYTRKYYTLRFIYAKEYNRDQDRNPNFDSDNPLTGINYSVIGGSTYGFGNVLKDNSKWFKSNQNYSLEDILNHAITFDGVDKWGAVETLPNLKNSAYVTGTYPAEGEGCTDEDSNGVAANGNYDQLGDRYHYFEITARYGADLTELWPVEAFDKVKVKNPQSHTSNNANKALDNDGWGNYAYLAGWNGEYKVHYSIYNSNSTVKGLYQKLDDNILLGTYDGTKYGYSDEGDGIQRQVTTTATLSGKSVESNVCYFISFFDNGANVSWSVPREWIYESYVPVFSDEVPEGSELYTAIMNAADESKTENRTYKDTNTGKVYYYYENNKQIYRLYNTVSTSDDNTISNANSVNGQTQTVLTGFDYETESGSQNRRYEQFKHDELTSDGRQSFTSRFFYKRKSFRLSLHNHGSVHNSQWLDFDSPMNNAMTDSSGELTVPTYPSTLEKDAYYFDGWYSSPECVEGTEYKLEGNYKMPATDVALYAKWAPTTHTVRFFQSYEDMLRYKETQDTSGLVSQKYVQHGLVLGSVENPKDKSGYNYTFGGWFYESSGKRLAYTPLDIPVVRDLDVFATWGSLEAQPYRLHYALYEPENDDSWEALLAQATDTPKNNCAYTVTKGTVKRTYIYLQSDGKFHLSIADDSNGYAYQGSTRTFNAKVGSPFNQLYNEYNKGYYPTIASHSMTLQYEENKENPQNNVFTFTYVNKKTVDYKVEYRRADTGELISSAPGGGSVSKVTEDAVVTERFAVIENYIPDAFYKRLILAVEKNENGDYVGASTNVIVFYYSPNTTGAYYAVHYMLQNSGTDTALDKDENGNYINYTESSAHTEGIGNVGQDCYIPPQSFSGFDVQETARFTTASGTQETTLTVDSAGINSFKITVSASGTELYIFYTRRQQEYNVYYLQYGTDISNLKALTYTDGSNGVLRPVEKKTAQFGSTVTESAENVSIGGMTCISSITQSILIRSNNDQNNIIFYYMPMQTTIEYKVWKHGGGTLDNTLEVFDGEASEMRGSKPTALEGYTFDGWYLDENCTVPVTDSGAVDSENRLTPNNNHLKPMPNVNVFYAKFLPNNGSLTITRENGENDESNGKQVFVYKIQAENDPDYVVYVTVVGNGSVTVTNLPCRKYKVEQQNKWSWRYEDEAREVTVAKDGATATFGAASSKNKQSWLNGNSERKTNRKG